MVVGRLGTATWAILPPLRRKPLQGGRPQAFQFLARRRGLTPRNRAAQK
jgi:hypothetical protein